MTLFRERGYAATTMEAVADAADVATPTVYAAFGTKAGLVARLRDRALAGDDAAVPLTDRDWYRQMLTESEPQRLITTFAAHTRSIYDRLGPVLTLVRDAAGADPDLRSLSELEATQRADGMIPIAHALHHAVGIRPEYTTDEITEQLWALGSPEIYQLLVIQRGWPPARYETWLAATLQASLLNP